MKISALRKKAAPYYACYVAEVLRDHPAYTLDAIRTDSYVRSTPYRDGHFILEDLEALTEGAKYLADKDLIRFIPDEFGPDLIVRTDDFYENLESLREVENSVFYKHFLAAGSGGNWIASALDVLNAEIKEAEGEANDIEPQFSTEDWEPLVIERDTEDFQNAMQAAERALETIEQNNGYAASDPDERNGIVNTIRGTLEALKQGRPSRGAVVEGMLNPFRYMAKKFGDSVMGEIAKIAVAAIAKWLFPF